MLEFFPCELHTEAAMHKDHHDGEEKESNERDFNFKSRLKALKFSRES